jgi:hypothetical protein
LINTSAISIPVSISVERIITLAKPIMGVELVCNERQRTIKLGPLSELTSGSTLDVCGEGFNERTIKVRCNGFFYFVLRHDVGESIDSCPVR